MAIQIKRMIFVIILLDALFVVGSNLFTLSGGNISLWSENIQISPIVMSNIFVGFSSSMILSIKTLLIFFSYKLSFDTEYILNVENKRKFFYKHLYYSVIIFAFYFLISIVQDIYNKFYFISNFLYDMTDILLFFSLISVIFYFASKLFGDSVAKVSERDTQHDIISYLRRRARGLNSRANFVLVMLVLVIGLASIFVIFAAKIIQDDVATISRIEIAQRLIDSAKNSLEKNQSDIASLTRRLSEARAAEAPKELGGVQAKLPGVQVQRLPTQLQPKSAITSPENVAELETRLKAAIELKKTVSNYYESATKTYENAFAKEIEDGPKSHNENLNFVVATGITRFAVIAIALFFVQILVNLYRYNIRLAGFYEARADALTLAQTPVSFHELIEDLAPDELDFGRPPKTPIQQMLDLIKNVDKLKDIRPSTEASAEKTGGT